MTTILIVIVFLVVGFAAIAALYQMNKKPADKCKDHSDKCGCDSGGGGAGAPPRRYHYPRALCGSTTIALGSMGQAFSHMPQPVQRCSSTWGCPWVSK